MSIITKCYWAILQTVTEHHWKLLLSVITKRYWAILSIITKCHWAILSTIRNRRWAALQSDIEHDYKLLLSDIGPRYKTVIEHDHNPFVCQASSHLGQQRISTKKSRTDASTLAYKFTGGVTMVGDDMEILGTCGGFFPPSAHYDRP